jgi:hypothetical protein
MGCLALPYFYRTESGRVFAIGINVEPDTSFFLSVKVREFAYKLMHFLDMVRKRFRKRNDMNRMESHKTDPEGRGQVM